MCIPTVLLIAIQKRKKKNKKKQKKTKNQKAGVELGEGVLV